jgi:hypothetical protein
MSNPDYSIVESRGSSVDPEATGPFPPNRDDRQRDVFLDQDDRFNGPRIEAEPITENFAPPQAFDVSPPPPMPILEFGQPQDFAELAAEAARAAINDTLRNMTINGVSPNVSGGNVSFEIPTEPSASMAFATMNAEPNIASPIPDIPAVADLPAIEAPQPPEVPETIDQTSITQPTIDTPEISEISTPETTPTTPPEIASTDSTGDNNPPPEPATPEPPQSEQPSTEAEINPPETEEAEGRDGKKLGLTERGKNEMRGEYEERMKNLKEVMKDESAAKAVGSGDMSYLNSGYLNVKFTRADGQREVLVQVDNAFAAVVKGAARGERVAQLPSDDAYYVAGGGEAPHPWQILLRTENDNVEYKVESASSLYSGLGSWDSVEITGLDVWQGASEGYVVLKGVVSNGACSSASIEIQGGLDDRIEFSDDDQTSFTTQIGFIFEEGDSLSVRQNAFHNFTLIDSCVNGNSAIYPIAI